MGRGSKMGEQYIKVRQMILETGNMKLFDEFEKYHHLYDSFEKDIENLRQSMNNSELRNRKSSAEFHDGQIDLANKIEQERKHTDEVYEKTKEELYNVSDKLAEEYFSKLFKNLSNIEKAIISHPRWQGLFLLFLGHRHVMYIKNLKVSDDNKSQPSMESSNK